MPQVKWLLYDATVLIVWLNLYCPQKQFLHYSMNTKTRQRMCVFFVIFYFSRLIIACIGADL